MTKALRPVRSWSLAEALGHLSGFVGELAGYQGKSARLVVNVGELMAPQPMVAALVPALMPLLKNAIVHGIEPPAARMLAGKPLTGTITLRTELGDDELILEVADDGVGIDPERLFIRAPERRGLADARERLAAIGGRIGLKTVAGEGTRCLLTLPRSAVEAGHGR